MPYKLILGVMFVCLVGCHQANVATNNEPQRAGENSQKVDETPQKAPSVFVAHVTNRQPVGNAALYTGVLNAKNGCLYIDDLLVVVTGTQVVWQAEPFWIDNHRGERFVLGDTVSVGGSQSNKPTDYINSPTGSCVADKAWLLLNIDKPFL